MSNPDDTASPEASAADTAPATTATPADETTTVAPSGVDADVVVADDTPAPTRVTEWVSDRTFADFPISPELLQGLTALGYGAATPVQAMTIDPALAGRDLLVRAKTGTGKTCAFCVPVLEAISRSRREGPRKPLAIMLAPTRELGIQVAQECTAIGKFLDVKIAVIYGGVGFGPQEDALQGGVDIVIGTPGRILDHARRGNLDLSGIRFAVLDEADEMLSMGFLEEVRKILDRTPKDRQSLFVSATINESVKTLIRSYLRDPEEIYLSVDGDNVSSITHILYETSPDYHKARALLALIEKERPKSAIIFCNTREDVNTVYTFLDRQGLGVEMISGELPQAKREKVMARVKAGAVQYLVSTDVAARGIDISGLSHVVNYSLPEDAAIYLHRCGRTGRIGNQGTAITLAGGTDFSTRLTLERQQKIQWEVRQLPTAEELSVLAADRMARTLKEASGAMAYEAYLDAARQIKERPDANTLIAVALRAFLQWDRNRKFAGVEAAEGAADGAPPVEAREERREDRGGRRDDRGGRGGRDDRGPRDRTERAPLEDRPRDDRPRDDRPRDDRPRDDRPREDRGPREDRAPREGRIGRDRNDRRDRPRDEKRPEVKPPPRAEDEATPRAAKLEGESDDTDEIDGDEAEGSEDTSAPTADGAARKKRRRRKKKGGAGAGQGDQGEPVAEEGSEPAAVASDAEGAGSAEPAPAADAEAKKAPRRSRSRSSKTVEAVAEAPVVEGVAEAVDEPAAEPVAKAAEPAAKRPASRRKAAVEAPAEGVEPAPKPARTRTPRGKAAVVAEAFPADPGVTEPSVADVKPVLRADPEDVAAQTAPAEPEDPNKPKRKGWWSLGR